MIIVKLYKIFMSSVFWGRSLYWSSKKNYLKSLALLERSIFYRGGADFEMLLRKGYLLGVLKRERESIGFLKEAIFLIEGSKKISFDEKKYLVNYASSLAVIMNRFDDSFKFDDDYDQDEIAPHFIDNFPYIKGECN